MRESTKGPKVHTDTSVALTSAGAAELDGEREREPDPAAARADETASNEVVLCRHAAAVQMG